MHKGDYCFAFKIQFGESISKLIKCQLDIGNSWFCKRRTKHVLAFFLVQRANNVLHRIISFCHRCAMSVRKIIFVPERVLRTHTASGREAPGMSVRNILICVCFYVFYVRGNHGQFFFQISIEKNTSYLRNFEIHHFGYKRVLFQCSGEVQGGPFAILLEFGRGCAKTQCKFSQKQ